MLFFYLNTSIIVEKQMLPSNAKQGISEGINRYVKTLFKILAKKKRSCESHWSDYTRKVICKLYVILSLLHVGNSSERFYYKTLSCFHLWFLIPSWNYRKDGNTQIARRERHNVSIMRVNGNRQKSIIRWNNKPCDRIG